MIGAINFHGSGINYPLWLRLRWLLAGIAIYLVVLAAAVRLVPMPMQIALLGTFALCSVIAHVLTVLTLGPADLGARGSGFPKHMFVLPLRTQVLVAWPMLIGSTSVALLWIVVATLVLRAGDLNVPIFWPAALAAAGVAWLQAIGWSPFASPFARVPALAVAITPLILLGASAGLYLESDAVAVAIVIASLTWVAAAYWFAVSGVARARAGSDGAWLQAILVNRFESIRKRLASARGARPPFASASNAHLWYELRRNAVALPMMFSFIMLPMFILIVPTLFDTDVHAILLFSSTLVPPSVLGLIALILLFVLFGSMYGPGMGKFDIWSKEQMPAFFAVRPMATSRYVQTKMVGASTGVFIAWLMLLLLIGIWAGLEATPWNPRPSVVRAFFEDASARSIAILILAPVGLLAVSCANMVTGMWPSLLGRKWLANSAGIVVMLLVSLAGICGYWIYNHPEYLGTLQALVPWLLSCLLILKIVLAAWNVRELLRRGLVSRNAVFAGIVGLVSISATLIILCMCFVELTITLALAMILAVPFSRIAFAVLALHWNRHR